MIQTRLLAFVVPGILFISVLLGAPVANADSDSGANADGTVHVQAFELPHSIYLDQKSRRALDWYDDSWEKLAKENAEAGPSINKADLAEVPALRRRLAQIFYKSELYQHLLKRYPVNIEGKTIGGVYCEVFTPAQGVPEANRPNVLINLHGGAFKYGSRTNSHLESVPIAAVGKFKVVSVDYRMAPEYRFPAATEDVVAVYRELLKTYRPENIAIYGASAGAFLTADALAQFQREGLPRPAAAGMLAGGAFYWKNTDGGTIGQALLNTTFPGLEKGYREGVSVSDERAFPGNAPEKLAQFPPSILVSSTRDFILSSVVHTHTQLVNAGVDAELHVWEGLNHVFHWNPELPEAHEVYDRLVRFFNKHLGKH